MPNGRGRVAVPEPWLVLIAAVVGCVGGIYGIGGGSILAPILISFGRSPREVAPATLAATLVTSIAGVATFLILSTHSDGSIAPDWGVGARARSRRSDRWVHRRSTTAPPSGGHYPAAARGPRPRHRHPLRSSCDPLTRTD